MRSRIVVTAVIGGFALAALLKNRVHNADWHCANSDW
jgi:hypothetical protein